MTLAAISTHIKVLERAGFVMGVTERSTDRALWTPRHWKRSRPGPSVTDPV
jgi:hypothetical protein